MINSYYTTQFTIMKLTYTGNKGTKGNGGTFMGHIQQADMQMAQDLKNLFTITHTVWCGLNEAVKVSDEINDGTSYYEVKAIQEFKIGGNQHKELLVQKHI